MIAQEFSNPCQVVVLFQTEEFILIPVSIHRHTSELQDMERLTFSSDSLLFEDNRTAVFSLDQDIDEGEEWGEDDEGSQGDNTVECSFHRLEKVFFECIDATCDCTDRSNGAENEPLAK